MKGLVFGRFRCWLAGCLVALTATVVFADDEAVPMPFVDQLASKEITALYQDHDGFLWIGTTHGVARYDGYDLVSFMSDYVNPGRLTNNYVTGITDSRYLLLVGTKKGLNVFDKVMWTMKPSAESIFSEKEIKSLISSSDGKFWIATVEALYRCDERLAVERRYELFSRKESGVVSLYEDKNGHIWALTWGRGLYRLNRRTDTFESFSPVGRFNQPFVLFQDDKMRYWLGTWGDGLYRFYPERQGAAAYERQDVGDAICFNIHQDRRNGRLWMLFYQALKIFEVGDDGRLIEQQTPENLDAGRMFSMVVQDRSGSLWLGAYDEGYKIVENNKGLAYYPLPFVKRHLSFDANLNCMYEESGGMLWLNQERYGLMCYDRVTGCNSFDCPNREVGVNYICAADEPAAVWVASINVPRVFRAERDGCRISFTDTLELHTAGKWQGHVLAICRSLSGHLWALTEQSVFVKTPSGRRMLSLPDGLKATCIADDAGRVWLGGRDGMLYALCPLKDTARHFMMLRYDLGRKVSGDIIHIAVDDSGDLWLGTSLGAVWHFESKSCKLSDETEASTGRRQPLLGLYFHGGFLYAVTPGAVIRRNVKTGINQYYFSRTRQVPVLSFRNAAACIGDEGLFYAGGHGGFVTIDPKYEEHVSQDSVRVTDVLMDGKSIWELDGISRMDGVLCVPSDCHRVAFSFSSLNYENTGNLYYEYALEDEKEVWNRLKPGENMAVYNNVSAGRHRLVVRCCGDNGKVWSSAVFHFIRLPRWYETWWARVVFVMFGASLLAFLVRIYILRLRRQSLQRFRQELAQTKLEYFTNVSHELLTPLTVLSCLADEIEERMPEETRFVEALRGNTSRLKKLIRQVLDFRKVEAKTLPLQVAYADVAAFVRIMAQTDFSLLTQGQDLKFEMDLETESLYGYFDEDKLEEMLFNLISNAVKYTDPPGKVGLKLNVVEDTAVGKTVVLQIWDEGIGIDEREQENIFNRFYRSAQNRKKESNGIGLSLTKELVELHHGSISVDSRLGAGSSFTIRLPLEKHVYAPKEICQNEPEGQEAGLDIPEDKKECPTVLVIDDNQEITDALVLLLGRKYRVLAACSVTRARVFLSVEEVALVVCDVRMSDTDGLTFCKEFKADVATSHIPIIMLTAQADEATRAACYEAGADAFISKPFDTKVLIARIENLLVQYGQRKLTFRQNQDINLKLLASRETDEAFLKRMVCFIEDHLQDSSFDLEQLASGMNLSKSTLNRKLKTMTDLTPMDFVRNIRLKYACRLLENGEASITEVAYAVGFSDPHYFTKCFKEAFGVAPKNYSMNKQNKG